MSDGGRGRGGGRRGRGDRAAASPRAMARARRRRLGARGEGRRRRKARVPTCDYTTNKKRTDSPGKRNTARLLHNKRVEDGASSVYVTPPILRPCCCGCVRRSVVWLRPAPPCSPPPLVASNFPIPHLAEVEGLRQDIISAQLWCGSSPLRSAAAASAACARHGPRGACRRRHDARHAPRPHRCARVSHARARLSLSPSLSVRPHNWPLHAL